MSKRRIIFGSVYVLLLAYIGGTALMWDRSVASYESRFVSAATNEDVSAASGKIFLDNDAYYWVSYARDMARTGQWRIRHTDIDNTPYGRPVHWSQSITWNLLLAGYIRHAICGEDISTAIERAAIWVGPSQMMIFALVTGILLYRRLGLLPSIIWMVNLASITVLQWYFHALRPDHHGLQIAFLLGSLLCLMLGGLGWTNPPSTAKAQGSFWFRQVEMPDFKAARKYFIASGILGGLGLWTGATVQLFGIGLVALGAMLLIYFMPPGVADTGKATTYRPELWRTWAITGAITSVIFYFIEYAPHFPGMRLEVNHPLYALSWICAGECMTRLSAIKSQGRGTTMSGNVVIALCALAGAVLPVLLWVGPASWHTMHDIHMMRMHKHILEFLPYAKQYNLQLVRDMFFHFGILPLFLLVAPMLTGSNRTNLYEWALLWMAFMPALAYAILIQIQVRWCPFFIITTLLLAMVTMVIAARHQAESHRPRFFMFVMIVALLAQPVIFLRAQYQEFENMRNPNTLVNDLAKTILQRQFASRMGALNTNGTFRVLCEPDMAARLYYYGGIPSVTSYYWENLDGLVAATAFMSDKGSDTAAKVVRERGITHVVLPRMAAIAHIFHYIDTGYLSESGARDSMAGRLLTRTNNVPVWLKRDLPLMAATQPGYIYNNEPVFSTMDIYTVRPERMSDGAAATSDSSK